MKKVYSAVGVRLGTFIGGPIAGGYLLSQNFKAIGRTDLARRAQVLGILTTLILTSILIALPEEATSKIPNVLLPLLFMFLANRLFERYQKAAVDQLLETQKGAQLSNWNAAGVALLFAIATFSLFFLFYLLIDPNFQ